eukprot:m.145313 g.145313  ORF g.145313 m.145313 type:complete len:810 (+) comp14944_c0_seq1:59-2488(+)
MAEAMPPLLSSLLYRTATQDSAHGDIWTHICNAEFVRALEENETFQSIITAKSSQENGKKFEEECRSQLEPRDKTEVLALGVASLQLFRQMNWTGPTFQDPVISRIPDKENFQADIVASLVVDGETVFPRVQAPWYLALSRAAFLDEDGSPKQHEDLGAWVWIARCIFAHQQILESNSASLFESLKGAIAYVMTEEYEINKYFHNPDLPAEMLIEFGHYFNYYGRAEESRCCWEKAQTYLDLDLEMGGALGVRTKFQTTPTPQLILNTKRSDKSINGQSIEMLPRSVELNDDTRLESIDFTGEIDTKPLSPCEQALILAKCLDTKNFNPHDNITLEEMKPYVTRVLAHPTTWSVHCVALITRSLLEIKQFRLAARSLEQIQILCNIINGKMDTTEHSSAFVRLQLLSTAALPPIWELEKKLALANMELGIVRDALDIFTRWQIWDNMIICLRMLEQDQRCEELVRERLKTNPSPLLWCVLGDIKKDEKYYEKAWVESKERSTRAQSSLGLLYLRRAEKLVDLGTPDLDLYRTAIASFQKAVNLNGMRGDIWFSMGCAALRVEDWDLAASAFRKTVDQDPQNFQAWNNLGHANIKQNRKQKAFYALKEACRCEYDNWKVWDNLCGVAVDTGAFGDAIFAAGRVLDIKHSFDDPMVLDVLVHNVGKIDTEGDERKQTRLIENLASLIERLLSASRVSPRVWCICGNFYAQIGNSKKAQECRKAGYREAKSIESWELRDDSAVVVVNTLKCLLTDVESQTTKEKKSALLLSRGVVSTLKRARENGTWSDARENLLQNELEPMIASLSHEREN